jgi:glutamate N-acetyltransferase/amino-acid N-acetyltransferase
MDERDLPSGYRYAGVHCGVRPGRTRLDLALVLSDRAAAAAGTFTQNRVVAAPVKLCRQRLPTRDARGIVICAGNANACTGEQGFRDAERMAAVAAKAIDVRPEQILVCATGVIGWRLPMPNIEAGIDKAAGELSGEVAAFERAATAIMTTDTKVKVSTIHPAGAGYRIAGFAKGAAMIGPNLATLLAFVVTDAAVRAEDLQPITARAAARTFNCVSVEGDTSTNDTLLFLANGTGPALAGEALARFEREATRVCADLARSIAADAEGASHFVTIDVEGLKTDADAHRIAKTVADSVLVKTAIFGADPNWGRIICAAGYAGVEFAEEEMSVWLGDIRLYERGAPLSFDAGAAAAYLRNNREIHIRLGFRSGMGRCTFWTSDLTYDYVKLNAEYTT